MSGTAAAGGRTRIVVAGYGNPLRGDDGAGWRVACAVRERYAGRPDVEVLARHEGVPVLLRQGSFLVASFHPELTDDTRVHERFLQLVREESGVRA